MSQTLTSKTVFTADVVTYDFLPEKYAEEKALITAELNVLIHCDWQDAINHVCIGGHLGGGVAVPAGSGGTYGLDANAATDLQQAQDQLLIQSTRASSSNTDTDFEVGSKLGATMSDGEAKNSVQQFVHSIASRCGLSKSLSYYGGDAMAESITSKAVNVQFKDVLTALLGQTITTPDETNTLSIDQAKVDLDLLLAGNTGATPWTGVPIENGSTTKLSELLSGFAFVPVLNRLVAGGGFTSGTVDGTGTPGGPIRFDMNAASDTTSDLIHNEAHLVFPVRIMFADDDVTNQETSAGSYNFDEGIFYRTNDDDLSSSSKEVVDNSRTPATTTVVITDGDGSNFSAVSGSYLDKYVKVNANSYVLQTSADNLVSQSWHSVKDNGLVAFQLNIIFSNKLAPDAIGSMA